MSKLSHSDEDHMDEIELKRVLEESGFTLINDPNNLTIEELAVCASCKRRVWVKNIIVHVCDDAEAAIKGAV